jgi:hypothetical protein
MIQMSVEEPGAKSAADQDGWVKFKTSYEGRGQNIRQ